MLPKKTLGHLENCAKHSVTLLCQQKKKRGQSSYLQSEGSSLIHDRKKGYDFEGYNNEYGNQLQCTQVEVRLGL